MHLPPFNINILDVDEYIQAHGALPVTSHSIFEAGSHTFHPNGLFSEAIFGPINSNDRLVRRAYLDLKTEIITPHLYKQLITLKSYYSDILAGKTYAYFDPELKDFVKTTREDDRSDTGYAFFVKHLREINFPETSSVKRHDKIALMKKFSDRILMTRLLVLPAGVRDIKDTDGRIAPEEINKFYLAIMSLAQSLPDNGADDALFDSIRYQIQLKVQAVYDYILNILTGKGGFMQGKFTHRHVVYSNRNVITAAILSRVSSPTGPNKFGAEDVEVPLFQGMKAATPLVIYNLKKHFFDRIFGEQSTTLYLIDPSDLTMRLYELENSEVRKYVTSDGLNDLINAFRNVEQQKEPVTVQVKNNPPAYMYLVYDDGDAIYLVRSANDFFELYSRTGQYSWEHLAYKEELDSLGISSADYVVVGSGAAAIYGSGKKNADVDIVLNPSVWAQLKKEDSFETTDEKLYTKGHIEVYNERTDLPISDWGKFTQEQCRQVDGHYVLNADVLLSQYEKYRTLKNVNTIEYLKHIVPDRSKLRPLTWAELFYIATYYAVENRHATATRHPVLLIENIQMYKVHLLSTQPSRIIKFYNGSVTESTTLPEYPRLDQIVKTSMSVGPWTLAKYDGDHDGDVLGLNILMSDEANKEVEQYMESPISMVDANGHLVYGLADGRLCRFALMATTYHSLE